MVIRTDTMLTLFPFSQVARQKELDEDILPRGNIFDFDFYRDGEGPWEDSREFEIMLLQKFGDRLDDSH